jgi:hypothetical protein
MRFRRPRVLVAGAMAALLLVLTVGLVVGYRGRIFGPGDPTPSGVSAQVRPGVDARLELPGVLLLVPGGAVAHQTAAHLAMDGPDLLASLPSEAAAMLQPVGRQVTADLSGSQPSVPLALQLDVPEGVDPAQLVLLSRHNDRSESMTGRYDPTTRRFTAQLAHLSEFRLVRVDPAKVIEGAEKVLAVLFGATGIAGTRPDCAGRTATLPDGRGVRVDGLRDADQVWPCVTVRDDRVVVTVHSGSAVPWRVRTSSGSYDGPAEVESADVVTQALYQVLVNDRVHNDGLVVPQGTGHWRIPAGTLPATVQAQVSGGAWFAEVGVFVAIYLADVFSGGAGTAAEVARRFHDVVKTDGWDCVMKAARAATDGNRLTVESLTDMSKAALGCVGPLFKELFGQEMDVLARVVVAAFGTGLAIVWGGLQISGRNALDVLQGSGANSILTWRIQTSGGIAPFVGEWHVHGEKLVINADGSGTDLWNAGPCGDTLCTGYSSITFTVVADTLVGRVTSVLYRENPGGTIRADTGADTGLVADGPHVKDELRLQIADTAVLKMVGDRDPLGNPYFCGAAASAAWHNRCNA